MEGCPRSLMLKLELKESHVTSFAPALKRYVREFYHEDGETYTQECTQLEQLRTAVIKPTYDNSGCNLLRRYYGQIYLLKTRFAMGEGSPASVEFTWTDLYTEDPITIPDISYEQSSILFNLGALHSLLGSREDRVSEEGMKVACTHYQSAAGAFTYIKENFTTVQYSDTSKDLLNLYINVMLGQAQECLLEKSMLDNRKNSLVARIAMQVQNYYTEAIACLTSSFGEILPPRMHKHWSKTLQIKCAYLNALAYMYMSNTSDEQGKYGEKVAFLKIAAQRIAEAQKLLKNQSQQIQEVVQFIADAVTQKLEGAKRDNDFIYHEPEPASTALPEIKGASLVKPIPFQPYDPSMGKDIFEKLIPMKAHESSSLYSEEKANLLRRYASIVSEKDKELSSWLASMHIDDLLRPEEADNLPADLTTKCESLQSNPGAIKKSGEMLTKLKEKGVELEKTLEATRKEVVDVQNEKNTFMEKYNVKLEEDKLKEYLDEVNSYQQKHVVAKKTNDELEKAFEAHRDNLELMIGPEQALHGILPSQNILDSPIEDDAVQRIRDLLAKIEKMKTQRAQFMDKLREQVNKDDITHLIATREGDDLESFFKEELKKHDESCELLQCNLDAQEKIMKALTEANAKYAHARRSVAEIKAKRDLVVKSLIGSYNFFMNFKDKVSSGVTFYNQLSEIFEKRRQEITTICKSEKERLQKIVEKAKQIKEERERKSESKVDVTLSNTISPERGNNPGNPQHPPPIGYQSQPGHAPRHPLSHQAIPHSLRGPAPNQPSPIQSGRPAQFNPQRGVPSNQPGMSQYIPRIPSATLLTARPRMSYPHPPFSATSQEGARPPTSVSWQPPPKSSDTSPTATGNIRFPPPQGIRPPNIPQGPSLPPQQYHGRPQLPMHIPQGQAFQHGQVGSGRGNWQPQQYGKGPHFRADAPDQNIPSQLIPQRPMMTQQPIMSHQPRPAGQPPLQQRPPSQILPPVQQHQLSQNLSQQPARPETPPSPQRIQQPYLSKPPTYQQQFGIGSNQQLQGPGPQHVQPKPQQPPGPYQNPHGPQSRGQPPHGQHSLGQRPGQYQQPGQQSLSNQQSRSHQIPTAYQQQPPVRMPPSSMQQPIQQPLQHQLPSHHHLPPSQHLPPQQQRPSGQYHQVGPYQQRFPYQQHQQPGGSHHQLVPQQTHQQGFQGPVPAGPPPHQQGPNQQPGKHISPVQNPPPTPYGQLPPSQVSHNLPPALEPQSYRKQPLIQKLSSENLPPQEQRSPYHPSQNTPQEPPSKPLHPVLQEKVPYPTSQHERPANPPTQLPYGSSVQPSQYPQAPTSQEQQASQASGQSKYQQWQQQQQQYGPTSPQHPHTQYQQTNKTVQNPNISKPGVYPSPSAYPLPTSSHNFSQTQQENRSSKQGDHRPNISKPVVYPSPNTSSKIESGVTLTYTHPTSSHNFSQILQENRSSQQSNPPNILKHGVHPSPSSQDIPTGPSVSSIYAHSNENFPQTHPSNTQNPNPSHDTLSPYFPAVSSQASQPYSKENQPTDNVSKGPVLSSNLNLRSKSFQEFNPTRVVLSKPGALSVSPLPANSSSTTSIQDLAIDSTAATQSGQQTHVSQNGATYNELGRFDSTLYNNTDSASHTSVMNTTSTAHLSIVKPKSTIDDKLLENLKSLDSPQPLPSKYPEKANNVDTTGPEIAGANVPDSSLDTTGLSTPDVTSQGLASTSSQEDVHKLQQKVLLQQQQLIEQQQRFLEQQTLGEHSQVWRLMEQIKQQQKELEELKSEMKVKDQFGEIERHLENLERHQNSKELKKTEAVKLDDVLGKIVENAESGNEVAQEMHEKNKESDKKMSEQNKGNTALEMGEKTLERSTQDQLNEITTDVNRETKVESSKPEEIKEDFLMSQLSQFSSTSSQHNNVIIGSFQEPTSTPVSEQSMELETDTVSDVPPPKPSRASQAKPDITTPEESKALPTTSTPASSKTDTPILSQESKKMSNIDVVDTTKENQAPPPKPIKYRPPPPTPEVEPEISHVTRDVFTKPTPDTDVVNADKPCEGNDEGDYVLRLAGMVESYRDVVNDLTKRQPRGPSILTKEWLAVQHYQDTVSQVLTCDVGKKNTTKNRYLDILPYDQTRVILQDKEDSDYINATMIEDLTPLSPKYIASQGPIPQCFMDFWLMVWQQKCPLIVMLTKEVEGKKLKCHQYWPKDEGHSMLFGSLRVTMKRQTSLAFWKERLIHITHNETHELHVVEHYQFTGWPDHGVPSSPSDFFNFMGHMYIRHQTIDPDVEKPILLHCSAGVGRTGAFIVMYSAMREMYSGNGIMEVQELVKKLREKRKYMVQKKEQYEFCYKGILHCGEQFLIIENSGNTVEGDSSDSLSSSDTYSLSSDDEAEYMKPAIPARPPISQNQGEISGNNETKQEGKKDESSNLGSEQASLEQSESNSGKTDSIPPKCEMDSEKSDGTSHKSNQNSEKIPSRVQGNCENVESGNTLNNFLEICTKSLPHDVLPVEINEEVMVPGGFQDTNLKISMAESSGKESSSSKGSDMGETKYKEITEEPEEVAKSGDADCDNTDRGTAGRENASLIPGLQEIQEGLIKDDDDDVINDQKGDVSVKPEENIKGNPEETLAGNVEILATETTTSLENDTTNLQDGLVECGDTPSDTEISPNIISPQETRENSSDVLPQKETDVKTEGENQQVRQELSSADKDISAETENQ